MSTKKITLSALMVALAMILSYIEALIPFSFGIPGIKLGLANLVVLAALYLFGPVQALLISVVRIFLISITFGSMAALLYSLAGGLLSFAVMLILSKVKGFSVIGVSVAGGVSHNLGQLIVAALVVENMNLFFYFPVLILAGVITGLLIGLALGFGTNGFCVLMSALLGDIHLAYSGFRPVPFLLFFVCVFIQSAGEELADRWYLYQKLRRRYQAPWIAIFVNSAVFMAMHLFNPGISILPVIQIFIVGVVFSLFVYYYNGLWIARAFHAAWNFTQSIFFGLPNSGLVSAYSVFKLDAASATDGPFYSVNFGVEGSPGAVLILLAVGIVVFLKNRGKGEHTDIWAKNDQV